MEGRVSSSAGAAFLPICLSKCSTRDEEGCFKRWGEASSCSTSSGSVTGSPHTPPSCFGEHEGEGGSDTEGGRGGGSGHIVGSAVAHMARAAAELGASAQSLAEVVRLSTEILGSLSLSNLQKRREHQTGCSPLQADAGGAVGCTRRTLFYQIHDSDDLEFGGGLLPQQRGDDHTQGYLQTPSPELAHGAAECGGCDGLLPQQRGDDHTQGYLQTLSPEVARSVAECGGCDGLLPQQRGDDHTKGYLQTLSPEVARGAAECGGCDGLLPQQRGDDHTKGYLQTLSPEVARSVAECGGCDGAGLGRFGPLRCSKPQLDAQEDPVHWELLELLNPQNSTTMIARRKLRLVRAMVSADLKEDLLAKRSQ